ncbi:HNH endonuclease [Synechococcus sp. PCC 7336]|uniref:HNH endonuclease n=1 Tax=Synechococcus sp. PCC 7336 TaxID=195250 RepID=UPI00034D9030|nr:HNH endonuclease [Synechococcus sp. PCC 7336]
MNPNYAAVANRAEHRCEYCRAPELVFNFPFEVEHIIPIALNGSNVLSNLALACRSCNLRKGTNISAVDPQLNVSTDLFHPRQDRWLAHFQSNSNTGEILGLTPTGRATIACLKFNHFQQLAARQLWIRLGLFP